MPENHSDRPHALLSASSSNRWLNCTPSARMEEIMTEDDEGSIYAKEGTLAHELAETALRIILCESKVYADSQSEVLRKKHELLVNHPLYTSEMYDYVKVYVEYVIDSYRRSKIADPLTIIDIEKKLDYSHFAKEGFGTLDCCIVGNRKIEIIDFKYGQGVLVESKDNSQLKLYGLGALIAYDLAYDLANVEMTIVQPRRDGISSTVESVESLKSWGANVVKPQAELAYLGKGSYQVGDWCKFCKAKPKCKALADHNLAIAQDDFLDPKLISDNELVGIYMRLDLLSNWAASVVEHMNAQAIKGKAYKGLKLVRSKSNRRWINKDKAYAELSKEYSDTDLLNYKLKGIADIEKLVGKENIKHLVEKPIGKPVLVSLEDSRPEIGKEDAKEDFKL